MKATARAHSNIAFIKYWGRKDEILRLPSNGSISMNLSNLFTTTTVEFLPSLKKDDILINGLQDNRINERISRHLDLLRAHAKKQFYAKVISHNTFVSSSGLASSASGFAALTYAGLSALGVHFSEKEVSIFARQGSGSACRSIPDGFVEWIDGTTSDESFAHTLFAPSHWDICDIVAIASKEKKDITSSIGQLSTKTSIFFQTRLEAIDKKITICKKFLLDKNFDAFGELVEREALEMHAIMFTSWPSLIYLEPTSLTIIKTVKKIREGGISVYFTIDAGPNIHIICQKKDEALIVEKIKRIEKVDVISNSPSRGTYLLKEHLF